MLTNGSWGKDLPSTYSTSTVVSIIIPAHNAAETLSRTLDSVETWLSENRESCEVLVVDDGSIDETAEVAQRWFQKSSLPGLSQRQPANLGAAAARNVGLEMSKGRWICFLDADDELAYDPVALAQAAGHDVTSVALSVQYWRNQRLRRIHRPPRFHAGDWLSTLTSRNPFQPSSLLCRRAAIEVPFDPRIACVEDWWFWLSNPKLFGNTWQRPDIVAAKIHLHDANISRQFTRAGKNREEVAKLAIERYADTLTNRQQANLLLQQRIGRIQQGEPSSILSLLFGKSNWALRLKAVIYEAFRRIGKQATPYG